MRDPHVRGVLILGLDAPIDSLRSSFRSAAAQPLIRGFAVGRSIFGDAARAWFRGEINDSQAVDCMAERFAALCGYWDDARASALRKESA